MNLVMLERAKEILRRYKKDRRALVKLILEFCEADKLLYSENEGMSVLLELNDVLDEVTRLSAVGTEAAAEVVSETAHTAAGQDQAPGEDNVGQWDSAQRERLHQQQLLQCFFS